MNLFKPKWYKKDIFHIDYQKLKDANIKYLIFDLDNTLGLVSDDIMPERVKIFLNKLKKDFTIIIASNSPKRRVIKFNNLVVDNILYLALKPTRKLYNYLIKYTQNMHEVCIIGDQIVTDILVGNRFNMFTILIDPLGKKDFKITSFNRLLEKRILRKNNLKRGEYYEKN